MRFNPSFVLGGFVLAFILVLGFQFYAYGPESKSVIIDLSVVPPAFTSEYYMYRAHARHQISANLNLHPDSVATLKKRCSELTQHEQLLDVECTALWTHTLHSGSITGMKKLWGFTNTHNGAITLELENGMRALFKPCTSAEEDTSREVIAFHIDHILGLGQVAPAVYRKIPIETLRKFVGNNPEDISNFQITESTCKIDSDHFFGPMIGWWDGLIPVRTWQKVKQNDNRIKKFREKFVINKKHKKKNKNKNDKVVEIASEPPIELVKQLAPVQHGPNLYYAQAESRFHTLYLLVDILRHGKDEFCTQQGHLVSLDFDRSDYTGLRNMTKQRFTWCKTCLMDESMFHTLRLVGPSNLEFSSAYAPSASVTALGSTQHYQLGELVTASIKYEEVKRNIWPRQYADVLTQRVGDLFHCINLCIKQLGPENVLLGKDFRALFPQDLTDRKIIKWYVSQSSYRDHNGMEEPDNIDEILASSEELELADN